MEAQLRIDELKRIREDDPYARKEIFYKNKNEKMKVFQIPLDRLIFNQYNGRIATFVKTYEKEHGLIDATTEEGEKLIDQFLWESKESRNRVTQKDLYDKGQLEYGIVTADGVVIDGNRRFMLIKRNAKGKSDATAYFKAIILEDTLKSNRKEIMRLETTYQMGVDDKVDYNPIQKYLKCRDLIKEGFSENEIAKMMGEKTTKIKEYLSILELMDKYLEECGYGGMYRVLETEKLEGQFVDLNNYLSRYKNKSGRKIQGMGWVPDSPDMDDLTNIYFDYMRADFGVHDIRNIANPAKDKGFFTQKKMWESFSEKHFDKVDKIKHEEKSLEEMRNENYETDVTALIFARDNHFHKVADSVLKGNLRRTTRELDDQNSQDEPLELLKRAQKTLEKINTNVEGFSCPEVRDISHKIRKVVEGFIKIVDGKG